MVIRLISLQSRQFQQSFLRESETEVDLSESCGMFPISYILLGNITKRSIHWSAWCWIYFFGSRNFNQIKKFDWLFYLFLRAYSPFCAGFVVFFATDVLYMSSPLYFFVGVCYHRWVRCCWFPIKYEHFYFLV